MSHGRKRALVYNSGKRDKLITLAIGKQRPSDIWWYEQQVPGIVYYFNSKDSTYENWASESMTLHDIMGFDLATHDEEYNRITRTGKVDPFFLVTYRLKEPRRNRLRYLWSIEVLRLVHCALRLDKQSPSLPTV